ncbi:uncharacterized protein [Panulirus ornatus]|uniref:uncharacterized protein n=1 Tax=Panulirus ornatus TaxID=150431 RepID=UPI003A8C400C
MLLWMLFLLAFGDRRYRTDKTPREDSYTSTTETPNPASPGVEPHEPGASIPSPPAVGAADLKGQATNASLPISTPSHDPFTLAVLYPNGKTSPSSEASRSLDSTSGTLNLTRASDGTTLLQAEISTTSAYERKDGTGLVSGASDIRSPRSSYVFGMESSGTVPSDVSMPRKSSPYLPKTSPASDEVTTPIASSSDGDMTSSNSSNLTSITTSSRFPVPGSYPTSPTDSKFESSNFETSSAIRSVFESRNSEPEVLTAFISDLSDIKKSIAGTREGRSTNEATLVCKNLPQWQKLCLKEADLRHLCLNPEASKFVCSRVPALTKLCSELRVMEVLCSKSNYLTPTALQASPEATPTSERSNEETGSLRPVTESILLSTPVTKTPNTASLTSEDPSRSLLHTLASTCSNPPDNMKLLCSTLPHLLTGEDQEGCSPQCKLNFFINNFYLTLDEGSDATGEENED